MTQVLVAPRVINTSGGASVMTDTTYQFKPNREYVTSDGRAVKSAWSLPVSVDGTGLQINLEPLPAGLAHMIRVTHADGVGGWVMTTECRQIPPTPPSGQGYVILDELPLLDPDTLTPSAAAVPAWEAAVTAAAAASAAAAAASDAVMQFDVTGKVAEAIADDATVAAAAQSAVGSAASGLDLVTGADVRVVRVAGAHPTFAYVMVDTADRMCLGIRHDGTVELPKVAAAVLAAPAADLGGAQLTTLPPETGLAATITDQAGRMSVLTLGLDGQLAPFAAVQLAAKLGARIDNLTKSDRTLLTGWGDSMTEAGSPGGSYLASLAPLLPGVTVTNGGISGQESGDIAIRQGGIRALVTVTGGQVPADTSAAAVTWTTDITPCNVVGASIPGTLAGVPGTLTYSKTVGASTFTRTTPGSAVAVPAGTPFVASQGTQRRGDTVILWTGRNDVSFGWPTIDTGVLAATRAMVANLDRQLKRFLVCSVIGSSTPSYYKGTVSYGYVKSINDALAAEYPDNYIDLRREMIDNGLALCGITPTADDLACIAGDTTPKSLLFDDVHPNAQAKSTVVAPFFRRHLAARGWI